MLWVVLGWTEAIELAQRHGQRYDPVRGSRDAGRLPTALDQALRTLPWHGTQWIDTFAARARDFWQLASRGWDTTLCAGGMIWNPCLEPYKNAITNELWVAASVALHRHFANASASLSLESPYPAAAVDGYDWLKGSNMTNRQGLYADGFYINATRPNNVRCDVRDEMIYTYNQGVVLSGQRGLWAATGSLSFLAEGHRLVRSVVAATGWDLHSDAPMDRVPVWRGLGRDGILEEQCDAAATCSQDAQAFKGIFFHLTAFCAPLDPTTRVSDVAFARTQVTHVAGCRAYRAWVRHNAQAALATRDEEGRFGMWWGAAVLNGAVPSMAGDDIDHQVTGKTDYRNRGTPQNALWGPHARWMPGAQVPPAAKPRLYWPSLQHPLPVWNRRRAADPNRRGRGRTVETQAGGLALMRASYEFSKL